jgi:NCS1 family nucleobase:cation symporter-1
MDDTGRLPSLATERIFEGSAALFRTVVAFGAAVWMFLMGSALAATGDTKLAVVGFLSGAIFGTAACLVGIALPCLKYGVDSIDASKTFLGVRGAVLAMSGLLVMSLGWAAVLMAMIGRGFAFLMQMGNLDGQPNEALCIGLSLAVLVACWALLRTGYRFVQHANDVAGPALILVATISLALLVHRYGVRGLWATNIATADALTNDRRKGLCYAVEFGLSAALAWWPFVGGLYRLVRNSRHAVNPLMMGNLCGSAYCAVVAALAAVNMRTADPVIWIIRLGGRIGGSVIVAIVLLMSIPALCMLLYFAAGCLKQSRVLARIRWDHLIGVMLAPLAMAAFDTQWVLHHVVTVATYGSLVFLSLSAVGAVDFLLLRRGSIAPEYVFAAHHEGFYWFWGGVNWVALGVVAVGMGSYLCLYNPISLATIPAFRYFGVGIPVMLASGLVYYALMRVLVLRTGTGGYQPTSTTRSSIEVRL